MSARSDDLLSLDLRAHRVASIDAHCERADSEPDQHDAGDDAADLEDPAYRSCPLPPVGFPSDPSQGMTMLQIRAATLSEHRGTYDSALCGQLPTAATLNPMLPPAEMRS